MNRRQKRKVGDDPFEVAISIEEPDPTVAADNSKLRYELSDPDFNFFNPSIYFPDYPESTYYELLREENRARDKIRQTCQNERTKMRPTFIKLFPKTHELELYKYMKIFKKKLIYDRQINLYNICKNMGIADIGEEPTQPEVYTAESADTRLPSEDDTDEDIR